MTAFVGLSTLAFASHYRGVPGRRDKALNSGGLFVDISEVRSIYPKASMNYRAAKSRSQQARRAARS